MNDILQPVLGYYCDLKYVLHLFFLSFSFSGFLFVCFFLRYFPSHCWEHFQFSLNQKKTDGLITSDHGICHPCLKEISIRESQAVSFNF